MGIRLVRSVMRSGMARAFACLFVLSFFGCTEGGDQPFSPLGGKSGRIQLSVAPRFSYLGGSQSAAAPINRIRLTAREQSSGTQLGQTIRDVASTDSTWSVGVDVALNDGGEVTVVVLIELISVTNGVETVEWSGLSGPIRVGPGDIEEPTAPITLFQGPPANLQVTGVVVNPDASALIEGDSVQLTAIVSPSGTPIWSSLDPTIATVTTTGRVITLLPGIARIVAVAGPRADTAVITSTARVTSIRLTPDSTRLTSLGQEITFAAQVLDRRGGTINNAAVTWSAVDPTIAEHLGAGRFRARANGRTVVRATSDQNGTIVGTAVINVAQRATAITLDPPIVTLTALGATQAFVATVRDANGNPMTGGTFTWRTLNPQIATVSAQGVATAVALGSTQIRAVFGGGTVDSLFANATLNVAQAVRSIIITPGIVNFTSLGDGTVLTARGFDANGNPIANVVFTWTSEAPAIATVNASGAVQATGLGSTNIRAEADGAFGVATVTVTQVTSTVTIRPDSVRLAAPGDTARFTATAQDANGFAVTGAIAWSSLDPGIATVNATNGLVTAQSGGTARIVATHQSKADTARAIVVQVLPNLQLTSLNITPADSAFDGDAVTISGVITNTSNVAVGPFAVRFRGIDAATGQFVAGADSTVIVPGLGAGAVLPFSLQTTLGPLVVWPDSIRARVDIDAQNQITETNEADNTLTTARLKIHFRTVSVVGTPDSLSLPARGDTARFTAVARDRYGRVLNRPFIWRSTDDEVMNVNSTGLVSAVADGRALVTVSAEGRADSMPVRVGRLIVRYDVLPDSVAVVVGDSVNLVALGYDATGASAPVVSSWSSSDVETATVTPSGSTGTVRGVSEGTAFIRATSGAFRDSTKVYVVSLPHKVWVGTSNSNWSIPTNWAPSGVPTARDTVIISGNDEVSPVLSTDVVIAGLYIGQGGSLNTSEYDISVGFIASFGTIGGSGSVILTGGEVYASQLPRTFVAGNVELLVLDGLRINGSLTLTSGVLNLGPNAVTVTGDLVATGGALLMNNPAGSLTIVNVNWQSSSASTVLTDGVLRVSGNFTVGSGAVFAPSGEHRVTLTGTGSPLINFANPGAAAQRFNHLLVEKLGSVFFTSTTYVTGLLENTPTCVVQQRLVGDAGPLVASSVRLTLIRLDSIPLIVDATDASIVELSYVTFGTYSPSAIQLTIRHPGMTLNFSSLAFLTQPTSGVGLYLDAVDTSALRTNVLTINMFNTTPTSPCPPANAACTLVRTSGGAVVNWPGGT